MSSDAKPYGTPFNYYNVNLRLHICDLCVGLHLLNPRILNLNQTHSITIATSYMDTPSVIEKTAIYWPIL